MKKVLICYFSGTGNTKKVVDEYARQFEISGVAVDIINIEETAGDIINPEEYDALGMAYPVWAFNAPGIVLNFAKKLQKLSEPKRAFILKTSGEPVKLNNASSLKLIKILKKRKYTVTNEYHYVMPYNIIFRHSDGMAYRMWNEAKKIIPLDCKEFLDGANSKPKFVPFGRLLAGIFRIQEWGGRFNGKRYRVYDTCVKCNKCVNCCPVKNITVSESEIKFGKNCLMCMRCAFECPKNAIKIGLFEKWKVNGAYSFEPPEKEEAPDRHSKYCKKSYDRYFARIKERTENAETKN